jgi:hypothetical protein
MELTESDNAQTNWQARGSRSDANFKGSATARVLSCRIYQRNSPMQAVASHMSAFGGKADIQIALRDVCF